MAYARFIIIDTATAGDVGTIPVGAKSISIEIKGAGPVDFGAYTLAADSPAFTVEAPTGLFGAVAYDATGSRAFIVVTYIQ